MRKRVYGTFLLWLVVWGEVHSFGLPSLFTRKPAIDANDGKSENKPDTTVHGEPTKIDNKAASPTVTTETRKEKARKKTETEITKLENLEKQLAEKLEKNGVNVKGGSDQSSSSARLVKRVRSTRSERRRLKMLVFAYSIARGIVKISPFLTFTFPYAFFIFQGFNMFVEQLVNPLDNKYANHRRELIDIMDRVRKIHPDHKEKDPVKIKDKKGNEVEVNIIDTDDLKNKERIPLSKMEPTELLSKAWNLR